MAGAGVLSWPRLGFSLQVVASCRLLASSRVIDPPQNSLARSRQDTKGRPLIPGLAHVVASLPPLNGALQQHQHLPHNPHHQSHNIYSILARPGTCGKVTEAKRRKLPGTQWQGGHLGHVLAPQNHTLWSLHATSIDQHKLASIQHQSSNLAPIRFNQYQLEIAPVFLCLPLAKQGPRKWAGEPDYNQPQSALIGISQYQSAATGINQHQSELISTVQNQSAWESTSINQSQLQLSWRCRGG